MNLKMNGSVLPFCLGHLDYWLVSILLNSFLPFRLGGSAWKPFSGSVAFHVLSNSLLWDYTIFSSSALLSHFKTLRSLLPFTSFWSFLFCALQALYLPIPPRWDFLWTSSLTRNEPGPTVTTFPELDYPIYGPSPCRSRVELRSILPSPPFQCF